MTTEVQTLEQIFQMMEPIDFIGTKATSLGKTSTGNTIKNVLDVIYNAGATGAMPLIKMIPKLDEIMTNASAENKALYKGILHIFNSHDLKSKIENACKSMAKGSDGTVSNVTFEQIIGRKLGVNKNMGIILTNSPFMTPAVRNAERCDIFLNSIPSIHASRMVPILEVEFTFNRVVEDSVNPRETFGLTRFMLGGTAVPKNSATEKMLQSRVSIDKEKNVEVSTVGMEMFTSPQTMVPTMTAAGQTGRYADIIDPMRPFASIESFVVTDTSTVGLMSYKKGTLTFKLHDRSRLAEIADLISPVVYQNAVTAPTVWMTYGWRYPYEPSSQHSQVGSRTFSDFINNNMLVREAYGVANSSYTFDNVGQVTVVLELWTKGINELRTAKITDSADGLTKTMEKLQSIANRVQEYANALNFGKADGPSKEIRVFQVIESAERGVFPEMTLPVIQEAINGLEKSFKKSSHNPEAANGLIKALNEFYKSTDKKNLELKNQIKKTATKIAQAKFDAVVKGADPFLFFAAKNEKHKTETGKQVDHPFAAVVDSYNKNKSDNKVKDFRKHVVSLGKLMSVFIADTFDGLDSIDEMQILFHQMNDKAGLAAGTNIAEFPIDMPMFFDQYRETIERKATERLTLEEFLKLIIDAQLSDTRALGYGYRQFFDPYDPASPHSETLRKGQESTYEAEISGLGKQRGPFQMPVIEMSCETTYSSDGLGNDLLRRFELQESGSDVEVSRANHLTRIMRIHIFDRTNNPYKTQAVVLKGQGAATFEEVTSDYAKAYSPTSTREEILQQLKGVEPGDKGKVLYNIDLTAASGASPYTTIKRAISRTMPSIMYGANGTMITSANLASKQDALMSTAQMQTVSRKSGKPSVGQPNGSGNSGLPLRIIPAALSLTSMGCPILSFAQLFFVDFNTGTTADNIYGITGLSHTITPGKFETQITMTFYDAYGKYEGAPSKIDYIMTNLKNAPTAKK
jgi:hypothetical protein